MRAAAAVTAAVALTFTLAACGGGDDKAGDDAGTQSESPGKGGSEQQEQGNKPQESETVIATIKGQDEITLEVTSVVRDSGGFVTVKGHVKNAGDKDFYGTKMWTGPELDIKKGAGGSSMAGATLVDKSEKKRYYILRDTENRPLATTGIPVLKAGSTTPVFMQFPAPPESTTEVDFEMPTFAASTLKITGE
ncbi:hypothetical protein [Streptomyces sp. NPDC001970]